jgi:hypothetical protein
VLKSDRISAAKISQRHISCASSLISSMARVRQFSLTKMMQALVPAIKVDPGMVGLAQDGLEGLFCRTHLRDHWLRAWRSIPASFRVLDHRSRIMPLGVMSERELRCRPTGGKAANVANCGLRWRNVV